MSYTNGVVSAPVSITDVQNAVSNSSGDLGTLILNGSINMWAKWKPVRKAIININPQLNSDKTWKTDAELIAAQISPWWSANDGNYGLNFDNAKVACSTGVSDMETALATLATLIDGNMNGWAYNRPTGGLTQPYRLTDFNRYNYNAPKPVTGMSMDDEVQASSSSPWNISIGYRGSDPDMPISDRDYITPQDISSITLYMGIAIFKLSGSTYVPMAWVTGTMEWNGQGIASADVADGVTGRGTTEVICQFSSEHDYYVLPFFSTQQLSQTSIANSSGQPTSVSTLITVPHTTFKTFTATKVATTQTIGYPDISNSTVLSGSGATLGIYASSFTLDSTGTYYRGGTASVIRVLIVNSDWNGTSTPDSGQYAYWQDFTNVTIGSEETITFGSCSNVTVDLTKTGWKVVMYVDGEATSHALRTTAVSGT